KKIVEEVGTPGESYSETVKPFNVTEALALDAEIRRSNPLNKFFGSGPRRMLVISSAAVLGSTVLVILLTQVFLSGNYKSESGVSNLSVKDISASESKDSKSVLAASIADPRFTFKVSVPSNFLKDVNIQGLTTAAGGIDTQNADINAGTGNLTAA